MNAPFAIPEPLLADRCLYCGDPVEEGHVSTFGHLVVVLHAEHVLPFALAMLAVGGEGWKDG